MKTRAARRLRTVSAAAAVLGIAVSAVSCGADAPAQSAPLPAQSVAARTPGVAQAQPPAPAAPSIPFTLPPPAYTGVLPPLPMNVAAPARPLEVVQAVYTFAARHPEVLHYVPCFCGCQRSGHKDNDDCFISGRDAKGRPTWEPHGMT